MPIRTCRALVVFQRAADLKGALRRSGFLRSDWPLQLLELLGQANNPVEFINSAVLFVNGEFRVADDVEEENVRDLKLDLLFHLRRHPLTLPKNQPTDNLILRGPWRAQLAFREMRADQDHHLADIRLLPAF